MMTPLVLASASPRRKQLLEQAGISFVLFPVKVSETLRKNLSIQEQIIAIAMEKADAAFDLYKPLKSQSFLILSADTEVILDGEALGKPLDPKHACQLLRRLSGKSHDVITALVLMQGLVENGQIRRGKVVKQVETTNIFFKTLSEQDIQSYVASGEPMDKAGAYGIQGKAQAFIDKIEGSYDNVVGLPVQLLKKMLTEFPQN